MHGFQTRIGLLIAAALVSGCASAKVGRAHTDAERKAAMTQMVDCFATRAAQIDDGISPAETVAKVIMQPCSPEIDAMIDAQGPFRSPRALSMSRTYLREHSILDTATSIVLMRRNKQSR